MSSLLPFIISGLVAGSLYGVAGLGLVLTYRTSGVFNFAHGTVAAAGAYLFYSFHFNAGIPWPIAAAITIVGFGAIAGVLLERITHLLQGGPQVVPIIATVGLLIAVQGGIIVIYGGASRSFPEFLPSSGFILWGVHITWSSVIAFCIAAACAGGLYVFMARTRLGIAMRAVVDNPSLVGHCGDNATRIRLVAWILGACFAALSGVLLAPTLGLDAILLTLLVVQAFGACAIGRFSSLPLTYAGGLVVGVLASLATKYVTDVQWAGIPSSVPFLVLIVALLVTPKLKLPDHGLRVKSGLAARRQDLSGRATATAIGIGASALLLLPVVVASKLPVWINFLSSFVLFGSLALLVWTSGQISLCHAAFAAIGATTIAHLTDAGVPWGLALPLAGLATIPVGILVALTSIRLSGLYLALVTLGFGILMQNVLFSSALMFGQGIHVEVARPHIFDAAVSDRQLYYLFLLVCGLVCAALVALNRSRLGRLLRGLSESPVMLTTQGLALSSVRMLGFCISSFFAGVAGAMVVTQTGSASGVAYGPLTSLLLIAILGLSGTALIRSAVIAALLYAVFPAYVTQLTSEWQSVAFGAFALVAAMLLTRREQLQRWLSASIAADRQRVIYGPVADRAVIGSVDP